MHTRQPVRVVNIIACLAIGVLLLLRLPVLALPVPPVLSWLAGLRRTEDASVVRVSSALELKLALAQATPGMRIELAPGTYYGNFTINSSGLAERPIVLSGNVDAVLDGMTIASGAGLTLHANHWRIEHVRVRNAKKGVVLDGASDNVLFDVQVDSVGEEGIRLRRFSANNRISGCAIARTGLLRPGYGEGVYIGTAISQWQQETDGQPDRSDRNQIDRCTFGPGITAENIDVKEGTSQGVLSRNVFDASAISGENYADSVVDLKGNAYVLSENRMAAAAPNPLGIDVQVHHKQGGWGYRNVFVNNQLRLDAKAMVRIPVLARLAVPPGASFDQKRGGHRWQPFRAPVHFAATVTLPAQRLPHP